MAAPTREEVMANPSVHNLTKEILRLSENKDVVDRVYDVQLALNVLREEMKASLNPYDHFRSFAKKK